MSFIGHQELMSQKSNGKELKYGSLVSHTAQKMKFFIKDFFSKFPA